jgi:glycosyltransferase involved in cell wall biosynthesis
MVSFIIPAHNEAAWIGRTLGAIRTAAESVGVPYEMIVVDDASTDETARLARDSGASVIQVSHRQIAATRNAGARMAKGDVFFFVDADTLSNAEAVQSGLDALRGGAVGGGCLVRFDEPLPLWARAAYAVAHRAALVFRVAGGCFLFCTRRAYEATGGFCEQYFAAEEAVFVRALKQHGGFLVVKPTVVTSARKLHAFSTWEILRESCRWLLRGPEAYRQRDGLDFWYGRREKGGGV